MLESSPQGEMMKKGEDNGIRTVECLRGRLLAERVASKAAKDEADLMAKKLDELEKQVAEEIKFRNRAEKRLKCALKRLKLLQIVNVSESSEGSVESCKTDSLTMGSYGQCGSGGVMEEVRREISVKDVGGDDGLGSFSGDSDKQMASQEGSWSSASTMCSSLSKEVLNPEEDSSGRGCEESINDATSQASHNAVEQSNGDLTPLCSLSSSEASHSVEEQNNAVQQAEHSDDMLALVPVKSTTVRTDACNSDVRTSNVQNVLLTLRHVKELLRNSTEARGAAASHRKPLYGQ